MRQSIEQDSVSAQLCVSSADSQQQMQEVELPSQPGMPYARDVQVDACSVQFSRRSYYRISNRWSHVRDVETKDQSWQLQSECLQLA